MATGSLADRKPTSLSPFMRLPTEIGVQIFHHLAISTRNADNALCPALLRPVAADGHVFQIGYFKKDTILSLMLVCRKFCEEVAIVLYRENVFVFHISGLFERPLSFLERLPPRYVKLMTKVYIRTGHVAADYKLPLSIPAAIAEDDPKIPKEEKNLALRREIAISAALVRQAWPAGFPVAIDTHNFETFEVPDDLLYIPETRWTMSSRWPTIVGHFWKMTVVQAPSGEMVKTFRRMEWQYHGAGSLHVE